MDCSWVSQSDVYALSIHPNRLLLWLGWLGWLGWLAWNLKSVFRQLCGVTEVFIPMLEPDGLFLRLPIRIWCLWPFYPSQPFLIMVNNLGWLGWLGWLAWNQKSVFRQLCGVSERFIPMLEADGLFLSLPDDNKWLLGLSSSNLTLGWRKWELSVDHGSERG